MAQALSHTSAPVLTVIGGQATTSSIDVARHFGKLHKTVLRAIANLDCSPEFTEHNFALSDYTDATGRKLPAYQLTRDGFMFLAMGFTGKNAARWKEAYINAFNRMEAALQDASHHPERINAAYTQAAQVAQVAALAVFKAVMAADDDQWRNARWMFALNPADATGHAHIQAVPPNAMVTSLEDLPRHISQPGLMSSNEQLVELATACNQQLVRRMNAMAKTAQPAHRAQSALMQ